MRVYNYKIISNRGFIREISTPIEQGFSPNKQSFRGTLVGFEVPKFNSELFRIGRICDEII